MSGPAVLSTVYATDENLAIRAAGDYAVLCPEWQKLAGAVDGAFAPGDPWTLASASTDFAAAGVAPQNVVLLRGPKPAFKGGGELLAVDSAAAGSVTLRRLGLPAGAGLPPATAAGLSGVDFWIASFGPQIEEESFILNRRFAIDPATPGRQPADLNDLRDLRYACVLGVLYKRYATEVRTPGSDFALKAAAIREELGEVYARLTLRWSAATVGQDATNWFSTRLVR